jgi:hypothetical protein
VSEQPITPTLRSVSDLGGESRRAIKARCFVCKKPIASLDLDPCAVLLVTNAYGPRDAQREQEFPCHLACFRQILNEDDLLRSRRSGVPNRWRSIV